MMRRKRLWIEGSFLLGITGIALLLSGILSFSKVRGEDSPAPSSSGSRWVFEVIEEGEEEFVSICSSICSVLDILTVRV